MVDTSDLLDAYAALRRSLSIEANDVFKKINLGSRQFIILWSLHRFERMTISELVVAAMTDKATVSRSLVQLIQEGLVEKNQCPKDGRVYYVQLSTKGKKLAPEMKKLYTQLADRCFSALKPDDRKHLKGLLELVVNSLGVDIIGKKAELL